MNKVFMVVLGAVGVAVVCVLGYRHFSLPQKILPTYFSYTPEEVSSLRSAGSSLMMTRKNLRQWENTAYGLVSKNKTGSSKAARFYAYLFTAQRDAAFFSYNMYGKFRGSLDPVSREVACVFYPDNCQAISEYLDSDPYSESLAQLVISKVNKRVQEDKKNTRDYPVKAGDEYWVAQGVAKGKSAGSWKTWIIRSNDQFPIPAPPAFGSPQESEQLKQVRETYTNLTDEQKRLVVVWAGGQGTKMEAGIWIKVATDYMDEQDIIFSKQLMIKSVLAMGLADAYIAANHYKYTFWGQRPFMRDNSIKTYMPTPDHPSYPSSAAAIAGLSNAFLNHYFPQNKITWDRMAFESSQSRIWSGIHFPLDVEAGFKLGEDMAGYIIGN